jgi:glycosyltransferase involved in cell wall biosynthesis
MSWSEKCAVVIPCFNEEAHISRLARQIRWRLRTVIVVDDGSSDRTAFEAERAGASVIGRPRSSGKGAAIQLGLARAAQLGFEWALLMDGDGQHEPDSIPDFLQTAERTQADLIVGNRMAKPGGMPMARKFVNRWMSRRLSALAGMELPDTQCGYRMIRISSWQELRLACSHFEIESEMLMAMIEKKMKIEFIPVRAVYNNERSKIHPLLDSFRWFRWLLRRKQLARPGAGLGRSPVLAEKAA